MNILLTNDDGIHAQGLWALHHVLNRQHAVTVIAPDRERSAVGHGITLHHPIRAAEVTVNGGERGWAVSGTPADCVKLALLELLDQRPDLVISGINPGANVGVNLNYSGTVAAAKEAALYGLGAIAVSVQCDDAPRYSVAADFVARLVTMVKKNGLPQGIFLNINVPGALTDLAARVCISRQGNENYDSPFDKRKDPRNRTYYWQGGESLRPYADSDADGAVLAQNCISITPVRCDMTDYQSMEALKQWKFKNHMEIIGNE